MPLPFVVDRVRWGVGLSEFWSGRVAIILILSILILSRLCRSKTPRQLLSPIDHGNWSIKHIIQERKTDTNIITTLPAQNLTTSRYL